MQITGKWIAVILIFLLSGMKLKTQELLSVMKNWQQNLYVQSNIFLTFSFITYLLMIPFDGVVAEPLRKGIIILGKNFKDKRTSPPVVKIFK